MIQFASIANPAFPQAEYERARATLPTWRFRLFYQGELVRPAGLIYADFVDELRELGGHLVAPFVIPPEWPRYGGIDFGAVHTARLLAAEDPVAQVLYLYSESLGGGKTTAEHAAAALAAVAGTNLHTWHGGSKSETQQRLDWQAAGVAVREPAVADVEAGIDSVTALIKTHRLYVFTTCSGLRDELGTYARQVDPLSGEPTELIAAKATFHRLDALRYLALGYARTVPPVAGGWDRPLPTRRTHHLFHV